MKMNNYLNIKLITAGVTTHVTTFGSGWPIET